MAPRNILIVMADQLTPFMVGCYGNKAVKTPHMDALAAQGVRFDAAYSNSPLCTPGRYAFMTGQYISRFGGWDNAAYLPSTVPTFAHYLRLMGYRTGLAGKMHFVGADQLHGFEERHTSATQNFQVFLAEAQPSRNGYAFVHDLLDQLRDEQIDRVFTFASLASAIHPSEEPGVTAAVTTANRNPTT